MIVLIKLLNIVVFAENYEKMVKWYEDADDAASTPEDGPLVTAEHVSNALSL